MPASIRPTDALIVNMVDPLILNICVTRRSAPRSSTLYSGAALSPL
jgi:hypothetical protein